MEYEESLKKIVKGAGIILVGTFFARILTFIYRIIVARIGVETYGLFAISLTFLDLISTTAMLGLDTGLVRYISYYKGKLEMGRIKGTIYFVSKISIITSLVSTFLLFILADWISVRLFHNPQLAFFLKMISFAIPLVLLSVVFLRVLKSYLYAKYEVYIKVIFENIFKIIFTFIFLGFGFKIFGVIMAYNLALFGTLIFSWYFVKKKIFSKLKEFKPINPPKKELIFYSLPLIFNEIILSSIIWIDIFMIPYFLDAEATGIYGVVILVVMLMGLVPYSLMYLFLPILTEIHSQNKRPTFNLLYKACTKWIFAANLAIFSFLLLISKEFLGIFFGREYVKDLVVVFDMVFPLSVVVLSILLVGFLIFHTMASSKEILIIFKRTKFIALNTIITAIFNIILNFYLIPLWGIIGAAIATSLSFVVGASLIGVEAYLVSRTNAFRLKSITIFFSAVLALVIVSVAKSLFGLGNIVSLVFYPVIYLPLYLLLLVITKSFEKEDIFIIKTLRRKLFERVS